MMIDEDVLKLLSFLNLDTQERVHLSGIDMEKHGDKDYAIKRFFFYLKHLNDVKLIEDLVAGFRSVHDPNFIRSNNFSGDLFFDSERLFFSFGKQTYLLLEETLDIESVFKEQVQLLYSQKLLRKYIEFLKQEKQIDLGKGFLFREYVYSLNHKPIFIIYKTNDLESKLKCIEDYIYQYYCLPCFQFELIQQNNIIIETNQFYDDFKTLNQDKTYLSICQYIDRKLSELFSQNNNINFTIDDESIKKQTENFKTLLSIEPPSIDVSAEQLAYFLSSTLLITPEWQVNYYIPATLLMNQQESGYSLFFKSRKEQKKEPSFLQLWRTVANMETIIPTVAYVRKAERQKAAKMAQQNPIELLREAAKLAEDNNHNAQWQMDGKLIPHDWAQVQSDHCELMQKNLSRRIPYKIDLISQKLDKISQYFHNGCKTISLDPKLSFFRIDSIFTIVSLTLSQNERTINLKIDACPSPSPTLSPSPSPSPTLSSHFGHSCIVICDNQTIDFAEYIYKFFKDLIYDEDVKNSLSYLLKEECVFINTQLNGSNFCGLKFQFESWPIQATDKEPLETVILDQLLNLKNTHSTSLSLAKCIRYGKWGFQSKTKNLNAHWYPSDTDNDILPRGIVRFSLEGIEFLCKMI